jgi:DNA-binding transcriptional MerR regulator
VTYSEQAFMSVQEVVQRTGFSEATLRYYERIALIPPVPRDPSSHHRRYPSALVDQLEALSCLRASGLGIDDMRSYLTSVDQGDGEALVALFTRHARRLENEMASLRLRRQYVLTKVELWQSRLDDDSDGELVALQAAVAAAAALQGER